MTVYVCVNGHDRCGQMYAGPDCPCCEKRAPRRREPTATSILLRALRVLRGSQCERHTTPGLGHCFRAGYTIGAKYGADKACTACIADRALKLAASVK